MSSFAIKLYEEREKNQQKDDHLALFEVIFGPLPEEAISWEAVDRLQETLYELDDEGPYGMLQRYVLEEHYLHGRSLDSIAKDFISHIGAFLADLNTSGVRWLQHPGRVGKIFEEQPE